MKSVVHYFRRAHKSSAYFLIILAGAAPALFARTGTPPPSETQPVQPLSSVAQLVVSPVDAKSQLLADAKRPEPTPMHFAVPNSVNVTPETGGTWEQLPDGRLWRLRIVSSNATDLNFGFTTFWLPEGATLHVRAENEAYSQGPYTAEDNAAGQLWTPLLPGDSGVIELFVPNSAKANPRLVLSRVCAGYRDMFHRKDALAKSEGLCNNDVVCPVGVPWTNEIRSVALYTIEGSSACSGTLISDVAGDRRAFFLTANHCSVSPDNANTIVVYWNYQSTNCGTHGPGSLAQNQSGVIFRAAKADVDVTLLELLQVPDRSFQVYYSGWERTGTPAGAVGIHHPDADVKAISFSTTALTTVNSCIGTGGTLTHWQVVWSSGVTEPGSSGSGIWNPATHKLVGTLSGGGSACSSPTLPDCYGKFSVAWNSGVDSTERLMDWLDPLNTGATSVNGLDPMKLSILDPAGSSLISESCPPGNGAPDPGETVTMRFILRNIGGVDTTNLVVTLTTNSGVSSPSAAQTYGAVIAGGGPVSNTFTFTASGSCGDLINPTLHLQDGARDLGNLVFAFHLGVTTLLTNQNFDSVAAPNLPPGWSATTTGGTAWQISSVESDTPTNSVFAADPGSITDNQLTSAPFLLPFAGQVEFRHHYSLEPGFDGGVLEISIGGGGFADIIASGGTFVSNGYTTLIPPDYSNPLGNRMAWSGSSGGFITTIVTLPPAAVGQNVQLRWRLGSDSTFNDIGWYVDSVIVESTSYTCCTSVAPPLLVNTRLVAPSGVAFSYDSLSGRTYFAEGVTNLGSTNWSPFGTNAGDGTRQSFTNSSNPNKQFFRVRVQ